MSSWFDIIRPHDDIIRGDFDEAVFAADLSDVHAGRAAQDYQNPHSFFKRTYLTQGLESLLEKVHRKLTEGRGPGVIELQTPFGGGKTHAQIAVYHYVNNGEAVQRLLPVDATPVSINVCVIVGAALNPAEPKEGTSGDIRPRTLWGHIGLQLGGPEGYERFADNDQARIAPGEDALRQFLVDRQPFVLLFDEILDYVTRARGVSVGDESSLAAQTLTFFQQLTNVVSHLEKGRGRGLLLATLPVSEMEDFSDDDAEKAERDLNRLDKIFGRLEAIETPVQGEEIYSIIKRRLFDYEGEDNLRSREVIDNYLRKYRDCQHMGQALPQYVFQDYLSLMEKSYPFHPETIDILYHKWGSFPKFQRTRGVLRLLANVLEDLYNREQNIDLILPGDVNLGYSSTQEELVKHTGRHYISIIGSDISDGTSKAQALDREHRGWKHLAERVSTAIFINSFSGDIRQRGTTSSHIRLGVLRPDTETALVSEVLETLKRNLWYLSSDGDTYYFSDIPNLNLMINDMKENVIGIQDEVRSLVEKELRASGVPLKTTMWPNQSADIGDNRDLKVAVLRESLDASELHGWLQKRGLVPRIYKNTIIFALPNEDGEATLIDKVKEHLAMEAVEERFKREEGSSAQRLLKDLRKRKDPVRRDLPFLVRQMYRTVAVPSADGVQTMDLGKPLVDSGRLLKWFWEELTAQGAVLDKPMSPTFLKQKFYSREDVDAISTADLLEQFYKEPSLPMLANENVLKQGIAQAVRQGALGLVRYKDGSPDVSTFRHADESFQSFSVVFDEDTHLVTFGPPSPPPPVEGEVQCVALQAEGHNTGRITGSITVTNTGDQIARAQIKIEASTDNILHSKTVEVEAEVEPGKPKDVPYEITDMAPGDYVLQAGDCEDRVTIGKDTTKKPRRLRLHVSGIRAARIADFHTGVLSPLSQFTDGEVTFSVQFDLESEDGFDPKAIENQVKETLRQIGATVDLEDLR